MHNNTLHKLGIDIGSTTVKVAVLDENDNLLFSDYERHFANIRETLSLLDVYKRQVCILNFHCNRFTYALST